MTPETSPTTRARRSSEAAGRRLGVGALLASAAFAIAFALLGINSIAIARIEGPGATGLVALGTQLVFTGIFVAGLGLRSGATARVAAGEWSPASALRSLTVASLGLGLLAGAAGIGVFALGQNGILSGFSWTSAAALMAAVPLALAWWTLPAVPLALERYEAYVALTIANPIGILALSPAGAAIDGAEGAVIGLAGGFALGGLAALAWTLVFLRRLPADGGPRGGVLGAARIGARAWVNDLFQLLHLRPDLFVVNAFAAATDVGVYSVAVSVTSIAWVLSQALATVVLPRSATLRADPAAEPLRVGAGLAASAARHGVLVSVAVSLLVGAGLFLVPVVWGPGFDRSVDLGLIMLPGVAALGVGRVMVASFTGLGHESYALLVGLISLPLSLVAYLLVVPGSGVTGAAVVSCASYLAASLAAGVLFARATGLPGRRFLLPTGADLDDYLRLGGRLRAEAARRRSRAGEAPR
jgi:O-antigen/teichoic acid export membrane protein